MRGDFKSFSTLKKPQKAKRRRPKNQESFKKKPKKLNNDFQTKTKTPQKTKKSHYFLFLVFSLSSLVRSLLSLPFVSLSLSPFIFSQKRKQMDALPTFWAISVPEKSGQFEHLDRSIRPIAPAYQLRIPSLRTGTLDDLMSLSDELEKVFFSFLFFLFCFCFVFPFSSDSLFDELEKVFFFFFLFFLLFFVENPFSSYWYS